MTTVDDGTAQSFARVAWYAMSAANDRPTHAMFQNSEKGRPSTSGWIRFPNVA